MEDISVDEKITLEWILGKLGGRVWTGLIWLRIGTSLWSFMNTVMNFRAHKKARYF